MRKDNSLTVAGLDDVNRILKKLAPKYARNLARSTVQAVASEIAKEVKRKAPKDEGNLKRAIKAQRKKSPPFAPRSAVVVEKGGGAKNDGWYWHFVEFGTVKKSERPFFLPVLNEYKTKTTRLFTQLFAKQLLKKLERERKRARKK